MLRSMYSGISGMKNFQTKLDVIGNNIANVNTYGFKKGRVVFKDLISQQVAGATAPGDTRGGVNPKQVGLGSQIASIDTMHTIGATQTTNRGLDLAIAGDGFFAVGTKNAEEGFNTSFTGAGNFYLDQEGSIVNADGMYLMGDTVDAEGNLTGVAGELKIPLTASSFSIGNDGKITYVEDGTLKLAGQVVLAKFENPEGLEKVGGNLFRETANSGTFLNEDGSMKGLVPGEAGSGTIVAGALEMSNVDLSEEFTEMIVAQRGFQSNTKIITTSDEILQELVNLKR